MTISPFTPLFFIDRRADGIDSDYRQIFAPTDVITLELLCSPEESPLAYVWDEHTGEVFKELTFIAWNRNNKVCVNLCRFSLPIGCYTVEIEGKGKCEMFEITDDAEKLAETVLIQYTMKDNRQRIDALFNLEGEKIFFDFRVNGGFKDSDWGFSVDSDQYSNEYSDIVQLYGLETTQKGFTMGASEGVPIWYGEFLNRILVCSYVYIDGVQYVRKESNTPEITQVFEGLNSFVFRQTLQKAVNIDIDVDTDNRIYLRREDGEDKYRSTEKQDQRIIVY